MSVILNFGNEASLVKAGKKIGVSSYHLGEYDKDILKDSSLLKDYISELKKDYPEIMNEPLYVTLSTGSGVIYKTFNLPADNLMINGNRTTAETMRQVAREFFNEQLPFGFEEEYISTVISECKNYTDYVICCAYVPKAIVDNLFDTLFEIGLSLFNVYPLAFGIYKAFDFDKFSQIVVDIGEEVILMNGLGVIVWNKTVDYSESVTFNYLINQSKAFYDIDNEVANTEFYHIDSVGNLLINGFEKNITDMSVELIAAFGLLYNSAKLRGKNVEEKGGNDSVISKLRFIFDSKTKK